MGAIAARSTTDYAARISSPRIAALLVGQIATRERVATIEHSVEKGMRGMSTWPRRAGWTLAWTALAAAVVWFAPQIASHVSAPRIDGSAPDFTLESTQGQKISLGAQRGKPTVVVFVASWCEVCREEMPTMVETFRVHQEHDVAFLGVDVYENWETARAFQEEFKLPFPLLVDAQGEVTTSYRVNGTPTTFFIDRGGIIRDVVVGGPLDRAYLDKEITPLLQIAAR